MADDLTHGAELLKDFLGLDEAERVKMRHDLHYEDEILLAIELEKHKAKGGSTRQPLHPAIEQLAQLVSSGMLLSSVSVLRKAIEVDPILSGLTERIIEIMNENLKSIPNEEAQS